MQRESYMSTSSYHPSLVESASEYGKVETLEPSKEIEGLLFFIKIA